MFQNTSSAQAEEGKKQYVCIEHEWSVMKPTCPANSKALKSPEAWFGYCVDDKYMSERKSDEKNLGFCPLCGHTLCPAIQFYFCPHHQNQTSFTKGSVCPICKNEMRMKRMIFRYRCFKCDSFFVKSTEDKKCPFCKTSELKDILQVFDRDKTVPPKKD